MKINYKKINEVYERLNQVKNKATFDVLKSVCRNPARPVKYIARTARADVNSTSKHIRFLVSIGLVNAKESGRELICSPNYKEIQRINTLTAKLASFYTPRIIVPREKEMLEV